MAKVITGLAISADGYIAGPEDGPGQPLGVGGKRLFEWYFDGDTPSRLYPEFRLSKPSAEFFDRMAGAVGAVITGRRTYDISNAWGGHGPLPGASLFVLTHRPPTPPPSLEGQLPYTYVQSGIADAVRLARAAAGAADVSLMGSAAPRQALAAGLLDQIVLHQVPVLLGGGVRLLDGVAAELRLLEVVNAPGVTHLRYEVLR
jgi:dihydrofolate reductase